MSAKHDPSIFAKAHASLTSCFDPLCHFTTTWHHVVDMLMRPLGMTSQNSRMPSPSIQSPLGPRPSSCCLSASRWECHSHHRQGWGSWNWIYHTPQEWDDVWCWWPLIWCWLHEMFKVVPRWRNSRNSACFCLKISVCTYDAYTCQPRKTAGTSDKFSNVMCLV